MGNVPAVTQNILDGSLGLLPPDVFGLSVKIGPCSSGTVNALASFSNKDDLVAALGFGPLVEAAAHHIEVSGQPVLCIRGTSTVGTSSAVVKTGTGTAAMTVAGNPGDLYDAIFEIVKAGASLVAATASFRYSLDGGKTYSAEIAVPVSGIYAIPNTGLTVTWVTGTFVALDTYTFTSTPPTNDNTAIGAAFDALLLDPREWGFVHVVGATDATKAATAATKMASAETKFRYAYALLELPDPAATEGAWITAQLALFASFASARVMIAAGFCLLNSSISGRIHRRSDGWPIAARTAKAPISESLGRVASGSLPGVTALYHDANADPTMADARFATLRTHIGRAGFYITRGQMMSAVGSDFNVVQRRRVMDRACQITRAAMLLFLEEDILVNALGGIDEGTAQAWETSVKGQLNADLIGGKKQHVSAVDIKIDRLQNVLTSERVKTKVSLTPLAYAKEIAIDIGFVNPALVAQAA